MDVTVVGAGSVGLSLGARLSRAGCNVTMLARNDETATSLEANGIEVHDPASGERFRARPRITAGWNTIEDDGRILLLCVRAPDTEDVVRECARVAPSSVIACAQNDVDNEACAALAFERVIGVVVRQTCTRTDSNATNALGQGRIIVGAYTDTARDPALRLGAGFAAAGYDVGVSQDIAADKWLKLCVNLMSVPNAVIDPAEHATPDFIEIKTRILEEARDVLAAARTRAESCDGRDRSLDEEIAFQRTSLERGVSARRLPVYNAVWGSLRHGSALEADLYHQRVLALAAEYNLSAPMNQRALDLLVRAQREQRGPESFHCADFLES